MKSTRRTFVKTAAAGGVLASMGDMSFLAKLPLVSAAETELDPKIVRLQPEIEPLVRLLEETPREQLLEKVAARIRDGATYREVLAALQLAGVRNVQPRPSVGFKFHAVLVVNSAHLASLASPDDQRWLPIFWAIDYFKSAQAQDVREGNWTMAPVDESAVPSSDKARDVFVDAMSDWDESAADAAVAGLARTAGEQDIYELFYRFGARDFRSIGHKAIFVANSQRTLKHIGWQHNEPILRSLAYALLMHEGKNPAKSDLGPDQPWRRNLELSKTIRDGWTEGKMDDAATTDLLTTLREQSPDDCCQQVVELLNKGVSPQSVWDALLVGAGELLVRQRGIVSLHAVTTSNALRYAFEASSNDETRRMVMLQNAAFLPLFRESMRGRGNVADFKLNELAPADTKQSGDSLVTEIFVDVSRDRHAAAQKTLSYLAAGGEVQPLLDAARLLVFAKGRDSHDYKFSSAVLEDYAHVSPTWRNRYMAASVFNLIGSGERDNPLVDRTRAALES